MTDKGPRSTYRTLDPDRIVATLEVLRRRIAERFPDSGLARVGADLLEFARAAEERLAGLGRPMRTLRIVIAVAIIVMVLVVLMVVVSAFGMLRTSGAHISPAEGVQAIESGVNEMIVFGFIILFLWGLEGRIKRERALTTLNELRSIAHVVDMHQLTKDPERFVAPGRATTPSSPQRLMTRFELARYLDYCSELLSLTSKLAALHAQVLRDPVVLSAVNDVEQLAGNLSVKVWQKTMILDTLAVAAESGHGPAAEGA